MAYIGQKECAGLILEGLKKLEYRGYDSAGISTYTGQEFAIVKNEGKIQNVAAKLAQTPLLGKAGIGHTRWATHGKPNTINAHPHRAGSTVLVHNGIIENYQSIRSELLAEGAQIVSETDSELLGHLIEKEIKQGVEYIEAVRKAFLRVEGSCSVVVVNDRHPNIVIAIRNGSTPLVVTYSEKSLGCVLASDAQALFEHSKEVTYLENQDLVVCTKDGFDIYSLNSTIIPQHKLVRPKVTLNWSPASLDRAGYDHYMLKEIFEQPRSILDTLDNLLGSLNNRQKKVLDIAEWNQLLQGCDKIFIVGCGTAWHAGLIGKYIIEKQLKIPVEVELASEFRYRDPIINKKSLILAISQSGETADTLAAVRFAKNFEAKTAAICNVRGSSLSREVDVTLFTAAGPEIGVASTKAFTTQVLTLLLMAKLDVGFFTKLPHQIEEVLGLANTIKTIAEKTINSQGFLYIARGKLFPVALEGALKMKEISYLHAEGYPAGELKHGPIAMVDPSMTIVVFAPKDALYEKNISNLQEVKARGGKIFAIGNADDQQLKGLSDYFLPIKFQNDWSDVLLATIPVQLLAYYTAVLKGTDVDKPRNLAKSVTVE